jgi:hypothetical protein
MDLVMQAMCGVIASTAIRPAGVKSGAAAHDFMAGITLRGHHDGSLRARTHGYWPRG